MTLMLPLPVMSNKNSEAVLSKKEEISLQGKDNTVKTYEGLDSLAFSEVLEVGPEGQKVDRLSYITKWEKTIKEVISQNPEFEAKVKDNVAGDELEEFLKTKVFDRPKEYFNERNLSRAYRVFADLIDYVKAGLGVKNLPSQEDQLLELVESIRTENDLNLEQTRLLKILGPAAQSKFRINASI
jgi:hypothetical protein